MNTQLHARKSIVFNVSCDNWRSFTVLIRYATHTPTHEATSQAVESRGSEGRSRGSVEQAPNNQRCCKAIRNPQTTLADHVHKRRARVGAGRPTILTPQEEKELVVTCQVLQRMGVGVTREIIGRGDGSTRLPA